MFSKKKSKKAIEKVADATPAPTQPTPAPAAPTASSPLLDAEEGGAGAGEGAPAPLLGHGSPGAVSSRESTLLIVESDESCVSACLSQSGNCCGRFVEDVLWGRKEAHIMIVQYCFPSIVSSLPLTEQVAHPCVLYNPLYYAMQVMAAPCLLLGKWVHALWGQGGPVRDDEMETEHEARIQWIYCTDGPMGVVLLMDIGTAIWDAIDGDIGWNNTTLALVMSIGVTVCYIVGNSFLYDGMRRRNATEVRIVIVCNAMFAIGLLAVLIEGLVYQEWDSDWTLTMRITFIIRFGVVAFMLLATLVYARLWNAYSDEHHSKTVRCQDLCPMVSAAVMVWTLLFMAFFINSSYAWDALTR